MRVLYFLRRYPQVSETYVDTELRALWDRHDIRIVSLGKPDQSSRHHYPFSKADARDHRSLQSIMDDFKPECLHSHYVHQAPLLREMSHYAGIPFTIRTHSYDVLGDNGSRINTSVDAIRDSSCSGVLVFPFARKLMVDRGVDEKKVIDCHPVVDFHRFYDDSPNGRDVMNVGACLPKKDHESFVDLALQFKGPNYNLYAMGYGIDAIAAYNRRLDSPVRLMPTVEHAAMPLEYKRHQWLVYSASNVDQTVGWPMAVAEAKASGVGVLMRNVRPDLRDYVGPSGYLFDTLDEVGRIIMRAFPEERRQLGFSEARRSDIRSHIGLLERLWRG